MCIRDSSKASLAIVGLFYILYLMLMILCACWVGVWKPSRVEFLFTPTVESLLLSQAFVVLASWTKASVRSSSLDLLSTVLIFLPQPTSLTGYADALAFVSDKRLLRLSKRSC
ncbi:hypothetical protein DC357_06900 [Vibrio vulnificus]|nr:hypothetical protein DC357_06900 [Vibrio vulnificus]